MDRFIDELNTLDKYMSLSEYNDLLYKYSDQIFNVENNNFFKSINIRDNHNSSFINQKLKEYKVYFDNLFNNVDSNIVLDKEQRKILLTDEDNTLVIAGAGSGKTTTMSAKVKYLVDKCNINPKDIIILSFTNQATNELKERINKGFNINVEISTFHKLAINILRKTYLKKLKVKNDLKLVITNYLLDYCFKNKDKLKDIITNFKNKINLDKTIYKYNNFDSYYNSYIKKEYYKNIYHIKSYNELEIKKNIKKLKSIEGVIYKRKEEVLIANYLYLNMIPYKYKDNIFTVFDNVLDNYKENNYIDLNTGIIKIILKTFDLKKIKIKSRSEKEIFFKLKINSKDECYIDFINLVEEFINKLECSYNEYKINDNKINNKINIIKEINEYYKDYKKLNNYMDFNDIINYAYEFVDYVDLNYKYIIIDEYQDISYQRYRLIRKIKNKCNSKILAVGDDWQSIYGFSGSKIDLFTNFYDLFGFAEIKRITKTYRNSQELIDIAGNFIMKNHLQIKKRLVSNKNINDPIKIIFYENKVEELLNILNEINCKNKKILLLGRYNSDIYSVIDNINFKLINDKIICLKFDIKLDFLTIHSSKGLGYDEVILLNFDSGIMGFPSQIENDDIMNIFIKDESDLYYEERRLFYVALTRTKNRIYIMCPKDKEKRSIFYREI